MGLAGPGGEVVLIEPAYDSYAPIAQSVGAVVRYVRLAPPNWRLTEAMLREAISKRTQAIVVNSPLNPIGRVFDREELAALARVVAESNAVVISDEVYEHLTFDGRPHVSPAALPGLNGRVARIGSAGKMFSLTGWKVGWVTGPSELMRAVANAHQFLTFTTAPSLQLAVAYALEHEMDFTTGLTRELQANRDLLAGGIAKLGFEILPCEGTYFLTADIRKLTNEPDRVFCERLVREAGVALIPLSVFFTEGKPNTLVRFAFCKQRLVIEEALRRLQNHFA
jgi:aspartate/methionine/tyrosine aminotransferase